MSDDLRNNISNNDTEIDIDDLYARLEKYKVTDRVMYQEELPKIGGFDLYASLTTDVSDFGLAKDFTKAGWAVRYTGNVKVTHKDGTQTDMTGQLGFVAAESNGRIILQTDLGYFGWLNPDDYEIINFIENFSNKMN